MLIKPRKKALHFIEENGLFAPGDTVVVAVSGGADSVALLDMLASFGELRLNLVVAHLNHMLRGAESDADEEFVRQLAENYGVPAVVRRVDVYEVARQERRSLEDAGRTARYAFLDDVAASHGANAVALAHHSDDQAETVLLRLLRGSGGSGLCAMSPRSAGRYVRPLLCLNRSEIEEYLMARALSWRNDSSNRSVEFLRNRIRHELLPFLSGYNPSISDRLAATAEALAGDEEVLSALTDEAFARHFVRGDNSVSLNITGVRTELRGIRIRLYRQAILLVKGDLERISFSHLKAIDRMVFSQKPNLSATLPDGLMASRCYDQISFASKMETACLLPRNIRIDGPGIYPLSGGEALSVDYCNPPEGPASNIGTMEYFDPVEAPFPWMVRTFLPGDRISPFGMTGHKKVKDLFIDLKIPQADRRLIPLLFCDDTLLWVAGIRRSSAAVIKSNSGNVIRIELLQNP
jgi:tRNA(Ile)-lysidine synthase